ncbi:MAG: acyltransferase [Ruminococcaceae bacterium]|nr:acyltransferase [Oscillospiraceae bacterium]
MELTKQDSKEAKGIAIIGMVMLHLFCRLNNFPYTPLIWLGNTPLVYYFGLFGDICVPTYCFLSGYAQHLLFQTEGKAYYKKRFLRILKFLVNFWIVCCVFALLGLFFDNSGTIPTSFSVFLGNFFLYGLSYNGAWWFVVTYIILVLVAPYAIRAVNNLNSIWVLLISGTVYFIAYFFRFNHALSFDHAAVTWLWTQLVLLGTSFLPFVLGALFRKHQIVSKIREIDIPPLLKNFLCVSVLLSAFIFHCFVPSLIVAPITATASLVCYWTCYKPKAVRSVLQFFGSHSTNIWLTHMFFYLVLFKDLVFAAKYPLAVLSFMLILCILTSYLVEIPNKYLLKLIDKQK